MKFERIMEFSPAYDKRDPDPAKDYGTNAVRIRFVLKGEHSAVQFVIGTNWYPEHIQHQREGKSRAYFELEPRGQDLGYHADAKHPIREYQSDREPGPDESLIKSRECSYTKSGRCFYDGSTLNSERVVKVLLEEGSDGVWRELEAYYQGIFDVGDKDAL